jgi:hypothetical protein
VPQTVADACPVGRGSPGAARWGSRQGPRVGGSWRQEDVDGRGESVGLSGSLPSLSRLFKSGLQVWVCWGVWSGLSGPLGPLAPVVPVLAAAVFPRLTPALEFTVLGADYGADAEGTYVDQPRSGGFQDQARMGLFVLPCGVLWASGACGSALRYHGRPLCFPWPVPDPGTRFFR